MAGYGDDSVERTEAIKSHLDFRVKDRLVTAATRKQRFSVLQGVPIPEPTVGQERATAALLSGLPGAVASVSHAATAALSNIADLASADAFAKNRAAGIDLGPLEDYAIAPEARGAAWDFTQEMYRQQAELMPEDPSILESVIAAPGPAAAGVVEAVVASAMFGPMGLPVLFGTKGSRDPNTGELTDAATIAKNMAIGGLFHKALQGVSKLPGRGKQSLAAGAATASVAALSGEDPHGIAVAGLTGMGLQPLMYREPMASQIQTIEALSKGHARLTEELLPRGPAEETLPPQPQPQPQPVSPDGRPAFAIPGQSATPHQMLVTRFAPELTKAQLDNMAGILHPLSGKTQQEQAHQILESYGGAEAFLRARGFERDPTADSGYRSVTGQESFERFRGDVGRIFGESAEDIAMRTDQQINMNADRMAGDLLSLVGHVYRRDMLDVKAQENPSVHNLAEVARAEGQVIAMQREAQSLASDMGRSLNLLTRRMGPQAERNMAQRLRDELVSRMEKKADEAAKFEDNLVGLNDKALLEKYGGAEEFQDYLKMIRNLEDPQVAVNMMGFAKQTANNGWGWWLINTWTAGLLSSPTTWKANVGGNLGMQQMHYVAERAFSVVWDAAKAPYLTGKTRQAESNLSRLEGELEVAKEPRWNRSNINDARSNRALAMRNLREAEQSVEAPGGQERLQRAQTYADSAEKMVKRVTAARDPEGVTRLKGEIEQAETVLDAATTRQHDRIYAAQAKAEYFALWKSIPQAYEATRKAWVEQEEFSMGGLKTHSPHDMSRGRAQNALYTWPFRFLTAQDAWFGAQAYYANINGLAMKQAIMDKVPRNERYQYVDDLVLEIHKPWEGVEVLSRTTTAGKTRRARHQLWMRESMKKADTMKFTGELGKTGKTISLLANSNPIAKVFLTFIRTPINLMKEAFYRIPGIGLLAPKMIRDFAAGGQAQSEAVGRQAAATVMIGLLWNAMKEGDITGAEPVRERDRAINRALGVAPRSRASRPLFDSSDPNDVTFESYSRWQPMSVPVAVYATIHDGYRRGYISGRDWPEMLQDITLMAVAATAETMFDQPMLQGPLKAGLAATQPRQRLDPWVNQMAGSTVPAGVNWMARAMDPYRRDADGVLDHMAARMLGHREDLAKRYDIVGRPQFTGASKPGPDPFSVEPDSTLLGRSFAEFSTQIRPHPVLNAIQRSGAEVTGQKKYLYFNSMNFAEAVSGKSDPEEVFRRLREMDANNVALEITPHERSEIDKVANSGAARELLDNWNIESMLESIMREKDPQAAVVMNDFMKKSIESVYARHGGTEIKKLLSRIAKEDQPRIVRELGEIERLEKANIEATGRMMERGY